MLKSLVDGISTVIDFVVDFFADLAYMIKLLGEFMANIPGYFSWLPSGVVAVLVTIFGVVVIYKILGREG